MNQILKRPLITEKIAKGFEKGVYVFIVDDKANKYQIKQAIKDMYNVDVVEVRTMRYQGKVKTRYSKSRIMTGRTNNFKKAIVQLKEGDIINLYDDDNSSNN